MMLKGTLSPTLLQRMLKTAKEHPDSHLELRVYADDYGNPVYPEAEIVLTDGYMETGSGARVTMARHR
jgi:hypothetical protein